MTISDELTIIIPAKNEEKLLPRLLASLLKQDYPFISNTRIFLADADSTDRTAAVAGEFSRNLAIIVIRGGLPSVGRNNGARCATSRYLLFVDADVELADPTLLRRAVGLIKRKSLHCVTTDILCRDGGWTDNFLFICSNVAQRLSRFQRPFATGMFMLLEKDRFDELGGFDEQALYAEDYQLTRQISPQRFRVIRGGVCSTNRRFKKMGHGTIMRFFLKAAINGRHPDFFRSKMHEAYWEAY
jgi:glycosyltransferase involved in cell wall biosynthesis